MVFTYSVFGYVRYVLQVVYHVRVFTVGVLNNLMNEMVNLVPTCIERQVEKWKDLENTEEK
jgi:hypothetical protein